jgi:uncharacterized protein YndB with AHSA1/START domain
MQVTISATERQKGLLAFSIATEEEMKYSHRAFLSLGLLCAALLSNSALSECLSFKISQRFEAPPERVFDAWLVKSAGDWLAPAGARAEMTDPDSREGGHYQLRVATPDGRKIDVTGSYRKIARPRLLEFTWNADYNKLDTTTFVSFRQDGTGTTMTVRQSGFPNAQVPGRYVTGWIDQGASFGKLAEFLAK